MKDPIKNIFFKKNVLITGASSGLGEEYAFQLAAKKANLILVSRTHEALERIKQEIELNNFEVQVHIYCVDLSEADGPAKLYDLVKRDGLCVDVLINNAGAGLQGAFENFSAEDHCRIINLNVVSVVALTRLFLPEMVQKKHGGVINMSSTAAFQPLPYFAIYAATKVFVLFFSEALWAEYQCKGVRVMAVCPGHTRTNFHARAGVHESKLFAVVPPKTIVEDALRAYERQEMTRLYGFRNRLLAMATRFLSRKCVVSISSKIFTPAK